jgi:hypothetical protein
MHGVDGRDIAAQALHDERRHFISYISVLRIRVSDPRRDSKWF